MLVLKMGKTEVPREKPLGATRVPRTLKSGADPEGVDWVASHSPLEQPTHKLETILSSVHIGST